MGLTAAEPAAAALAPVVLDGQLRQRGEQQ
jgi:hypothetical protein